MKKNIVAIILVFAMLAGFASCKKLENEGEWVVESKVYVTDLYGAQHDVQAVTKTDGETEYYYYNSDGNRVTVAQKDVVVSTTKVYKPASTTLSPEMQSFFEAYSDPDSFQQLVEEQITQPELNISEDPIPEEDFEEIEVELGSDGRPERGKDNYVEVLKGDSFTAKFVIKSSDYNGEPMAVPFYVTKNSDNLYINSTMPVDEKSGMNVEFLVVNKQCYIIIPAMRAYFKMTSEQLGEFVPDEALDQEMADTYVSSAQVEVDGVTYECDIYDAEGQKVKYYYLNDELKRVETADADGNVTIIEYDYVKKGADRSKFKVPTGYMDMTTMMGENFNFNTLA